ncbi:MAG: gamma-glutamyl-phosphate reductase, partial [Hyphomicrobiales bacterium]|nr:gamma-glutamyl-phosphate reductase [Hyphomicrobiales bacterium]
MSLAEVHADGDAVVDVGAEMAAIGKGARAAAQRLANATTKEKNVALKAMAKAIRANAEDILSENLLDVDETREAGAAESFVDRLTLNPERIEAMAAGIEAIAALPDPVGKVMDAWDRPNGLRIERVRPALGVIGIIYESRAKVTAGTGALCVKGGNGAILRGGSDSFRSAGAIHDCLVEG